MKKTKRLWALLLVMVMALGLISTAFAAPTIDSGRKASLSLYKYDITAASADGAWDAASYVSTGVQDDAVTDKLAKYAIQGVEFSYLRVASISTYSQRENGQYKVGVLYGFADDAVLQAIGLGKADAYKRGNGVFYFTSDKLNKALADALADNATTVKNALEIAVRNGGKAIMPETDANGHSRVGGLEQGLYLVVETRVPENVTSTCNPFFVSLPMTTMDGKNWNYDVTVYPKNQTGSPGLEKTVREDKNSTPTITSKATSLTTYTFVDTMSEGIRYNRSDVVIEFFRDAGCTDQITAWDEDSGKFAVSYDDAQNTMTIGMTETGLADINESASVYTDSVKRGYSDCTMRITYAATLTADAQLGDTDNPNEVVLIWKRTNTGYFDTLQDCCHVYTYGVDVLKQFSDGKGDLANVHFLLHNDTDGYFVTAMLVDGVYHVTGHEVKESKATVFAPNGEGHIRVMGLEDDTYTLTEIDTDKGYVLLKDGIEIIITAAEGESACETCGVKLLTASGSVNGDAVGLEDGNAIVPLTVINNPGFDLPKTGGYGTWMFTVGGCMLLGVAAFIVVRGRKHNRNGQ
ncbi:MAG: SpaH/EbpB family LPXTG-anchored major pilin [Firmicutes bacterium]|nr:SpaH/EbpB family LPXTG-anchored major pilin [Bacillota bacterium]